MSVRDQSLWEFCLSIYAQPAIEQICLHLQDQGGANVNILLWLCWLADRGIQVDQQQLNIGMEKIANWHGGVVTPLRQLRRGMKQDYTSHHQGVDHARETIKAAELAAEKVELDWLEELASSWITAKVKVPRGANLQGYFKQLGLAQTLQVEACDILQQHPGD